MEQNTGTQPETARDAAVQSRNPNDQHVPATHGREGAGIPAESVSDAAGQRSAGTPQDAGARKKRSARKRTEK